MSSIVVKRPDFAVMFPIAKRSRLFIARLSSCIMINIDEHGLCLFCFPERGGNQGLENFT